MKSAPVQASVTDVVKEFDVFWAKEKRSAQAMMEELGRFIRLADGKYRRGTSIEDDVLVLSKWGFQKTCLNEGRLMSGSILTTAQAVEIFQGLRPTESFMEKVREGERALYR